jgi:hypothetical protein
MINDLVKRALTSAEIPSIREPNGYYREDFLWDVTCTDTLAQFYIRLSSKKVGEATRLRENVKKSKYLTMTTNNNNYYFVPIAIETMGP